MSHEPVVTRCETVEEAAAAASEVLATAIASARTVRGRAHVALSGGSVVGQTYRMLGGELSEWRDVHLWYGDERVVPRDDPESTHRLATETLDAPGATWHPLAVDLGCEGAAAAYAEELDGTVIDIALMGMGPAPATRSQTSWTSAVGWRVLPEGSRARRAAGASTFRLLHRAQQPYVRVQRYD